MPNTLSQKLQEYLKADPLLQRIYDYTKERFNNAPQLTAHNWEHIYRDTLNAIAIGEAENANMAIVLPAMLMHDIGFLYGADGKTHGAVGADKLPVYLREGDIKLSNEVVEKITDCIRTHKGSMHGEKPDSLEAKVVADADLLEKFGLFGVYQGIRTFTEFNYSLETIIARGEATTQLFLQTKTGRELAEPSRQFVIDFFRKLKKTNRLYE